MIRRVGEKETGTPLLNSISKMSLFRLFSLCLPINCYFRFEFQIQADKPILIGYCGHPHFDHLVSRLLLAISRSIRSKNENAKTSHSRFDQLCEISF